MVNEKIVGYIIDINGLPDKFPTHKHKAAFWGSLGRSVATFRFLKEISAKAIFAFTAIRPFNEAEIEKAYEEWLPKLDPIRT
jgi:hypothetical protein